MTETTTCTCVPKAEIPQDIAPQDQYRPLVDIFETPDALEIKADLPGVKQNDLDVTFEDGSLTIVGKVQPRQGLAQPYTREEYGIGEFRRSFFIQVPINADAITAQLKNGELTVRLPKTEQARTKKVPLNVG